MTRYTPDWPSHMDGAFGNYDKGNGQMNPDYHNGQNYQYPEPTRREKRVQLERDVQNLIGLIPGIATLSDAELYGMRDELMAEQRAVNKAWEESNK